MDKSRKPVRVTRTTDRRTSGGLRKLSRALIALAEAQLEAEAQAEADARAVRSQEYPATAKKLGREPSEGTGDAA